MKFNILQKNMVNTFECCDRTKEPCHNYLEAAKEVERWLFSDNEFYRGSGRSIAQAIYYLRKAFLNYDQFVEIIPHEAFINPSFDEKNFRLIKNIIISFHKEYKLNDELTFKVGDWIGQTYVTEKNMRKHFMNKLYCLKLSSGKSNFLTSSSEDLK